MAARNFKRKQALETGIVELYCKFVPATVLVAATATIDLSTDVVLTSVAGGAARNGTSVQLVVNAPAANPTNTVLVAFTGTAAAIVITVTPNDGTNNGAVAVSVDEDELAEVINTGLIAGKVVTLTDTGSLRILQTATGGAAADALTAGDNQTVSFAGGVSAIAASFVSNATAVGFASVARNGVGSYLLTMQNAYAQLKSPDVILQATTGQDIQWQVSADEVADSESKSVQLLFTTSGVAADPSPASVVIFKAELKNSSVRD